VSRALQLWFSDREQVCAKKKQKRLQIFLDEIEATIPWDDFHALIHPVYHQPSAKGGRPQFALEVMLRIHLLQQWFRLSDPLMEEMLIDTDCFRRFARIDMVYGGLRSIHNSEFSARWNPAQLLPRLLESALLARTWDKSRPPITVAGRRSK
jgi:hypothetical protein